MGANTSTGGYSTASSSMAVNSSRGSLLPSVVMTTGSTGSGGGPGNNEGDVISMAGINTGSGGPQFREQRRKRVTGFATLKRKFIRRRRSSKVCDHGRVLRDFVSDWTPFELAALYEEYEVLSALRDLSMQAELARPPATTFKQDLASLYEMRACTDCDLVYRGSVFPVHRSIVSSRCSYFRDLLANCPGFGAHVCIELPSSPIDVQTFSSLLRYLYTGDLCPHEPNIDISVLRQLGNDFGTPNPLENDLRYLLETGDYSDATLVFTAEGNDCHRPDSCSSEYGFRPKLELPCHKAILSARSPFFRNLIARRRRNVEEYTERSLHVPTRIVLDETVIPKRYARVLLHAIYLDTLDLSLILRTSPSGSTAGSLGEVHALTNTGRTRPTPLEEAMELYQIGRFLELDILAQGSEDLILDWLSLDTLPAVLKWGSQAHGSAWIFRQACQYLREEFSAVAASPVLHQLDKQQMINVLQSNFLQASELEVLQAVLKWGEQELMRRIEHREPNLLSHTAHSVARKGVKKRDLSDVELREILFDLLPLVRIDHVIPPNSEILCQAIRRGLISTPPSHMVGDDRENLRINAWTRGGKNQGLFVRPRLFMPYFEEVKSLLEDRITSSQQQVELMRTRRAHHMPNIPDTLYMVSHLNAPDNSNNGASGSVENYVDSCGISANASIPSLDPQTIIALLKRENKLRQTPIYQRALLLPLSCKHEIDRQIRLRVVREFNLPDALSNLMETFHLSAPTKLVDETGNMPNTQEAKCSLEGEDLTPPPSPAATTSRLNRCDNGGYLSNSVRSTVTPASSYAADIGQSSCSRNITLPRPQHITRLLKGNNTVENTLSSLAPSNYTHLTGSVHNRVDLPALITEGDYRYPHGSVYRLDRDGESAGVLNGGVGGNSMGHLSDMMPDVAMATASLGQLHLINGGSSNSDMHESLQLDLGDGSSHIMSSAPSSSMNLRRLQQLPVNQYNSFTQRPNTPFELLRPSQHLSADHSSSSGNYSSGAPRFS